MVTDLRVLLTLTEVRHQLSLLAASGGTVPCWENVDYECDDCPVLTACAAHDAATDSGGVRCRG